MRFTFQHCDATKVPTEQEASTTGHAQVAARVVGRAPVAADAVARLGLAVLEDDLDDLVVRRALALAARQLLLKVGLELLLRRAAQGALRALVRREDLGGCGTSMRILVESEEHNHAQSTT